MNREKAQKLLTYLEIKKDVFTKELSNYITEQKSYNELINELKLKLVDNLLENISYNSLMFDFELWIRYENSLDYFNKIYKKKLDEVGKIWGRIGNLRHQLKDQNNEHFYDNEDDEND